MLKFRRLVHIVNNTSQTHAVPLDYRNLFYKSVLCKFIFQALYRLTLTSAKSLLAIKDEPPEPIDLLAGRVVIVVF